MRTRQLSHCFDSLIVGRHHTRTSTKLLEKYNADDDNGKEVNCGNPEAPRYVFQAEEYSCTE